MPLEGRVPGGSVRLAPDSDYREIVLDLADGADDRLWCSLFIIDPSPAADPRGYVREIIRAVAGAVWRKPTASISSGARQRPQRPGDKRDRFS
jgi:hypothetical protein